MFIVFHCLSTAYLLYHIFFCLSRTFLKFFKLFPKMKFCHPCWRLDYFIIDKSVCQQVFYFIFYFKVDSKVKNNGEGGIWTLAPRKRPTPLAGAPLQPLEYFSIIWILKFLFNFASQQDAFIIIWVDCIFVNLFFWISEISFVYVLNTQKCRDNFIKMLSRLLQERLWRSCRGVVECEAFFHWPRLRSVGGTIFSRGLPPAAKTYLLPTA